MTAREKTIALCVAAAAGLYALDAYLLTPYFDRLRKADDTISARQDDMADADQVMQTRRRADRTWRDLSAGHLMTDAPSAEQQLLNRVRDCANTARLQISGYKTEKSDKEKGYDRVSVKPAAAGTMEQIARFLYEIQRSDIPVRVNDVSIVTRKDGQDDLAFTATLSTIYRATGPTAKVAALGGRTETY